MHTDQHGWERGGRGSGRGTLFARRVRVLECGDWSPLLRRRLVAVELPRASVPAGVPALARAVSAPLGTRVSRSSTATSRLGKALTSPALDTDRRTIFCRRRRAKGASRSLAAAVPNNPRLLCVSSPLCGVLHGLPGRRPVAEGREAGQNTAERGRNAESRGGRSNPKTGRGRSGACSASRNGCARAVAARDDHGDGAAIRIKSRTSHRTPKSAPVRLLRRRAVSLRVPPWFRFRVQVQSAPQAPMLSRYQSLRKFVPSAPWSPSPAPPFGTEERAGERRRFAMVTRLAWAGHPSPLPAPRSCLTGRGRRTRHSSRRLRHKLSQRLITA